MTEATGMLPGGYWDSASVLHREFELVTLTGREEELLALTGEVRSTPYNAYNLLTNADIKFPNIKDEKGNDRELDDSAFYLFMRSSDRRVRKDAYEAIVGAVESRVSEPRKKDFVEQTLHPGAAAAMGELNRLGVLPGQGTGG
jgi:hypothetical protein